VTELPLAKVRDRLSELVADVESTHARVIWLGGTVKLVARDGWRLSSRVRGERSSGCERVASQGRSSRS
jgi:hypothetical protein